MENELRRRRTELKLTQKDLGIKIGIGGQTIANYETYHQCPVPEKAAKLAIFFNTTIEDLFPEWLDEMVLNKEIV